MIFSSLQILIDFFWNERKVATLFRVCDVVVVLTEVGEISREAGCDVIILVVDDNDARVAVVGRSQQPFLNGAGSHARRRSFNFADISFDQKPLIHQIVVLFLLLFVNVHRLRCRWDDEPFAVRVLQPLVVLGRRVAGFERRLGVKVGRDVADGRLSAKGG